MSTQQFINVYFSNGLFTVDTYNPTLVVEAINRVKHGDWKTQLVREEFMGMEKGQQGNLVEVFENCYGLWGRVSFSGRTADVRPTDLKVIKW